jgi:hypothetical protein
MQQAPQFGLEFAPVGETALERWTAGRALRNEGGFGDPDPRAGKVRCDHISYQDLLCLALAEDVQVAHF